MMIAMRHYGDPGREAYTRAFELGERKGFREGRRCARPVVVKLSADVDRNSDGASTPLFSQ